MKKVVILTLMVAMFAGVVNATVSQGNKEIVGEWKYEAPSAPYGYEKGSLIISEKEGALAGVVKFEDGYKIELKKITYAEGVFKCGLYVDYEYVSIKTKVEGKNMKGAVTTPEGDMPITATKIK
ncbi:MAG: hypothetical protein GQ525_16790 [Draconibacterium sp.]|nr:hypothetical protein [Draconibacterium sp.]